MLAVVPTCLYIPVFICLFVRLTIYLSICVCNYLFIYLSVFQLILLSIRIFTYHLVYTWVYQFIYVFIYLSIYLSINLSPSRIYLSECVHPVIQHFGKYRQKNMKYVNVKKKNSHTFNNFSSIVARKKKERPTISENKNTKNSKTLHRMIKQPHLIKK